MKNGYYNNRRMAWSIICILLGLFLLILTDRSLIPDNGMSGFGYGLIAVGAVRLFQVFRYRKDEAFQKKVDIAASDERYSFLSMKAWSWTGYIGLIGAGILTIVMRIMGSTEISRILSYCVCAELLIYAGTFFVLSKKY
ncbi:hypothetical protein SAMN04487771_101434 [[Clostridium] aminophilum]|uniref:Uncharacterized protein n=1 Tax=[Clostridium] aminophilum TaxID=1526 RepID=A0A1I0DUS8_9FIRM|nr:hypothetical protein [[Clostridium] aminophilum]SET35725.1 hypothetical protein SAMN04487771_101434 [[Clostridium] aminophilum]